MASESASGLARNELLLQYIQELGYDVDFKTSLAKLEKNSEGRITGIIAQSTEDDHFIRYNANKGVLLAIAFEEAALNTINHNEHVSMIDICLLLEEGSLIVRIRDDGAPFDPLAFVDDEDILQMNNIRLLERLTDQKTYTRIMNMNNTVLSIRLEAAENDGANDGTC